MDAAKRSFNLNPNALISSSSFMVCLVGEVENLEDRKNGKRMKKFKDRKDVFLMCLVGGMSNSFV